MNQYTQEHARSYYAASARASTPYPLLDGDLTADVCVIGGGFTGNLDLGHVDIDPPEGQSKTGQKIAAAGGLRSQMQHPGRIPCGRCPTAR